MNAPASRTPLALRMEYCAPGDRFANYCLWDYEPIAPTDGKWASANLLFHSFEEAAVGGRAYEIVERIRAAIGVGNTVWGLKLLPGSQLAWEFYFYDYRRRERERSISRVLAALRPLVPCDVIANEALHYFMFSLDFDEAIISGARGLDTVHMYIGNVGSSVSSGISYGLTRDSRTLENFYFFYKPDAGVDQIAGKVLCSAFIDPADIKVEEIIWPELIDCHTVCVANKRTHDCIYFSGIDIDQFLFALRKLQYPPDLTDFIAANRARLDHLLYDIGYDYKVTADGLHVIKSGYYGTF